jgi:hypothetical protein
MSKRLAESGIPVFYVLSRCLRERRNGLIGVGTVVLVVAFASLFLAVVTQAPLIFLKFAEDSVGESDLVRILCVGVRRCCMCRAASC